MSGLTLRRLARAILRCYPPLWRRRYAPEVHRLIDDAPARWSMLVDLGLTAVSEWMRPRNWGPPVTALGIEATAMSALSLVSGSLCVAAGRLLGRALSSAGFAPGEGAMALMLLIESLFFLRVLLAMKATPRTFPAVFGRTTPWLALGWTELGLWTAAHVVAMAVEQMGYLPGGPDRFVWYRPTPLFMVYMVTRRGIRVTDTLGRLRKRSRYRHLRTTIGSVFQLDGPDETRTAS